LVSRQCHFGAFLILIVGAAGHGNGAHYTASFDYRQRASAWHNASIAGHH